MEITLLILLLLLLVPVSFLILFIYSKRRRTSKSNLKQQQQLEELERHQELEEDSPATWLLDPPPPPQPPPPPPADKEKGEESPAAGGGEEKRRRKKGKKKRQEGEAIGAPPETYKAAAGKGKGGGGGGGGGDCFPFSSFASATQRKIKVQYDELVKSNQAKQLTMAQVGQFVNCLVEARNELQHKSVIIQRSFKIKKALLVRADRSSFDRLCQQIYKLEAEHKKLEEDVAVYNLLQEQLKLSPAYNTMLEVGANMELKGNEEQALDTDFCGISFEELLAQEKEDSFWQKKWQAEIFCMLNFFFVSLRILHCCRISSSTLVQLHPRLSLSYMDSQIYQ